MKKILSIALCLLSINSFAGISIGFPPDMDLPDFGDYEQAQKIFIETVETLTESTEVQSVVADVEQGHRTTCVALTEKASRGLIWFRLRYRCEGEQDLELTIKARLKKEEILVKDYTVKL